MPYMRQGDDVQLAGKPAQQVLFGVQTLRSFLRNNRAAQKSCGIISLDVAAAFYRTLRQISVGATMADEDIARVVKDLGVEPDVMHLIRIRGQTAYTELGANAVQQAPAREIWRTHTSSVAKNVLLRQEGHDPEMPGRS